MNDTGDCGFCAEAATGHLNDNIIALFSRDAIYRTCGSGEDFFVVPSVGPLCDSHYLLCSKNHYHCARDMPVSKIQKIMRFIDEIGPHFENHFGGSFFWFESGSPIQALKSTCIDHTHVHLLTIPNNHAGDIISEFQSDGQPALSMYQRLPTRAGYYCFGRSSQMCWMQSGEIPSQHWRSKIANALGSPLEYNWRDYPKLERLKAMTERPDVFNRLHIP